MRGYKKSQRPNTSHNRDLDLTAKERKYNLKIAKGVRHKVIDFF